MEIEKWRWDVANELKKIAKDIVRKEGGGLGKSQFWGLRLRIIADKIVLQPPVEVDGPKTVSIINTDLCKKCDKLRILSVEDKRKTGGSLW